MYRAHLVQGTSCTGHILYRVHLVQGTSCTGYSTGYILYRVHLVQGTSCTGHILYRAHLVQGTSCTGHILYRVHLVQGTSCTGYILPIPFILITLTPRHYNTCRVLADSRSRLQPSLSLALLFQFLTPGLSVSLITPSIHPSKVWPSHSPSAFRLVQGDFLTRYLHSYYMSCPSEPGYPNCCYLSRSYYSSSSFSQLDFITVVTTYYVDCKL